MSSQVPHLCLSLPFIMQFRCVCPFTYESEHLFLMLGFQHCSSRSPLCNRNLCPLSLIAHVPNNFCIKTQVWVDFTTRSNNCNLINVSMKKGEKNNCIKQIFDSAGSWTKQRMGATEQQKHEACCSSVPATRSLLHTWFLRHRFFIVSQSDSEGRDNKWVCTDS